MKTLALLSSLLLAIALPLRAEVSPVRIDVRQNLKTDATGKSHETKKQMRSLSITLNNNSNAQLDSLAVKYWFFTRDQKDKSLGIHKEGEHKAKLAPHGKADITTETVTSTYTSQHAEVSMNNNKNYNPVTGGQQNNPTVKRIEASGDKIIGYAVQVLDGGKVVAEYYSEPSLREKVSGAAK